MSAATRPRTPEGFETSQPQTGARSEGSRNHTAHVGADPSLLAQRPLYAGIGFRPLGSSQHRSEGTLAVFREALVRIFDTADSAPSGTFEAGRTRISTDSKTACGAREPTDRTDVCHTRSL